MSERDWTPEPWIASKSGHLDIGIGSDRTESVRLKKPGDIRRIASCVNGCKDIPIPAGLSEVIEAFKDLIVDAGHGEDMNIDRQIASLKAIGIEVEMP